MKYHYKSTQRMAGMITAICFLLFVAYSLSLFTRHQPHMLALANFVASGCVTDVTYGTASSVWIAALLGTSLCAIPAVLLLHSFHFPIGMKRCGFLAILCCAGTDDWHSPPVGGCSGKSYSHRSCRGASAILSGCHILQSDVSRG